MKAIFKITFFVLLVYGNVNAQNHFEWAERIGGNDSQNVLDGYVDDAGNVFSTGQINGTTEFYMGVSVISFTPTGVVDGYITKHDSLGNLLWVKQLRGTTTYDYVTGKTIETDNAGNIYITGDLNGIIDFDPGAGTYIVSSSGSIAIYVLKLDSIGNFLWVKTIAAPMTTEAQLDSVSNIVICGRFDSSVDFDPGPGIYNLSPSAYDAFILKLDVDGNFVWAKKIGGSGHDEADAMQLDSLGNIYMLGQFSNTVDFDPGAGIFNLTATSASTDVYMIKWDATGNFIWAKQIVENDSYGGDWTFTFDSKGDILITGNFNVNVDVDPSTASYILTAPTGKANFLVKWTSAGIFVWAKYFSPGIEIWALETDRYDNIYIAGGFYDTTDMDLGPGIATIACSNIRDGYIAMYNASCNFNWVHQFEGLEHQVIYNITVENDREIVASGAFQNTTDFDPDTTTFNLTSSTPWYTDAVIFKWSQNVCSDYILAYDTFTNVTCSSPAFVNCHMEGCTYPVSYQWYTTPPVYDSIISFNAPGIYNLIAIDSNRCIVNRNILVSGVDTSHYDFFDLQANLLAIPFQAGANTNIWLDAYNDGCDTISGTLMLILDTLVFYDSASIMPDIISGDTLVWNFSGFNYDSAHIIPQVFVTTDMLASIGDTVCFTVIINPVSGDIDSSNNYKKYCFPVVSSFGPTIKSVYPQGKCWYHYVNPNQKMTYTIQFQNTGTANATNVYVLDTLDPDLDLNSVHVVGNSHLFITEVLPGNVLKFRFDNINLPDSGSNEASSHGYLIYEVDQLPSLPNYTYLENKAYVYFDLNIPVATNSTSNAVIDIIPVCEIGINENASANQNISTYPNPTNSSITISTSNIIANKIELKDVYGRTIKTVQPNSSQITMDLQNIANGIYFVSVLNRNITQTVKIIKQ